MELIVNEKNFNKRKERIKREGEKFDLAKMIFLINNIPGFAKGIFYAMKTLELEFQEEIHSLNINGVNNQVENIEIPNLVIDDPIGLADLEIKKMIDVIESNKVVRETMLLFWQSDIEPILGISNQLKKAN